MAAFAMPNRATRTLRLRCRSLQGAVGRHWLQGLDDKGLCKNRDPNPRLLHWYEHVFSEVTASIVKEESLPANAKLGKGAPTRCGCGRLGLMD